MYIEIEGNDRGYVVINQSQSQFEMGEQGLNMREVNEMLEDQILGDSLFFFQIDLDIFLELVFGKGKSRGGFNIGLDYIRFIWKRFRLYSRQCVFGLYMNRERKVVK